MTESSRSRRSFLTGGVAAGLGGALSLPPGWSQSPTEAPKLSGSGDAPHSPGRLVVVFQRGGMDALSAVVPAAEAKYYDLRPTIAVPESAVLDLDGRFGFHPALAPLHELYVDRRVTVVHAAGNPAGNRSHFEAQDLAEQGDEKRRSDSAGWLTRHFDATGGDRLFRAVCLANNITGSLRGSTTLAIPALGRFTLGGRSRITSDFEPSLRLAYQGDGAAAVQGAATLDAIESVASLTEGAAAVESDDPYAPFADAAVLLDSDLGVEVVTINTQGWDTHNQMGTHQEGTMTRLLGELGRDLARFQDDLDSRGLDDVTTLVMTEFGRCIDENGSGGTDHGFAGLMLTIGGGVEGGRVITDWPGLEQDHHHEDLMVTTDFRDVLWELVRDVLGNPSPDVVFEGHKHKPVGLTG
jgi:uncharacterized protein (DUF1501 family)